MDHTWYRGKVVLVPGASSGIGRAVVERLAAAGANVIAVARSQAKLAELAHDQTSSAHIVALPADVGDRAQMQQVIETVLSTFGHIDIVIYSAGIEYLGPIETVTTEEIQEMLRTNFLGFFHIVQLVLPGMLQSHETLNGSKQKRESGTIAYVSSPMARCAFPWSSAYAASKAATDAFIVGLRHELVDRNIRLVTVYPGPTKTQAGKHLPAQRLPFWHEHGAKMEPSACADLLLNAVAAGHPVTALSGSIRMLFGSQRLVPSLAERIISRVGITSHP
jgi:NAD(P)-dependent dehydrogenase (short-subunit alcohol dehydrogenase family)